jgi:hypothetical protein
VDPVWDLNLDQGIGLVWSTGLARFAGDFA